MTGTAIGILHPGSMGASVGASARTAGNDVYWASEGRSQATVERAHAAGLIDAGTIEMLCRTCRIIISVCPPHAAEELASYIAEHGFNGLFLDANAISPERTRRIEKIITNAGASFVDGGIIGGPAWKPGRTWLYLSGEEAGQVANCFTEGALETEVIGTEIGKASALKMCYAAYTKGTTALLSAILATAEALNVRPELEAQWSKNDPDFATQTQQRVRRVTAKAWRFAGEMEEIAQTLDDVGMPGGFHRAASEIYQHTANFKDAPEIPELQEVFRALLKKNV